ncbi:hypothetical protein BDZ88DRAFT_473633 [Geranomyces variabilis]|nr:hypothetical protein BDZ88DRAFT_473633 [Geranomyces variabilis]
MSERLPICDRCRCRRVAGRSRRAMLACEPALLHRAFRRALRSRCIGLLVSQLFGQLRLDTPTDTKQSSHGKEANVTPLHAVIARRKKRPFAVRYRSVELLYTACDGPCDAADSSAGTGWLCLFINDSSLTSAPAGGGVVTREAEVAVVGLCDELRRGGCGCGPGSHSPVSAPAYDAAPCQKRERQLADGTK